MEDIFQKHATDSRHGPINFVCFYINLAERQDRLAHVKQQLPLIGIKGERLDAIRMPHGHIGCTMSHIKCLELAIERNCDYALVCEDDITFTDPAKLLAILTSFLASGTDWDVLLLGGNNMTSRREVIGGTTYSKVTNCQTTTGYIVRKAYIQILLDNFRAGLAGLLANPVSRRAHAIDMYWKRLQVKDRWYILQPQTVCQMAGYSDIEKRMVNYRHTMISKK